MVVDVEVVEGRTRRTETGFWLKGTSCEKSRKQLGNATDATTRSSGESRRNNILYYI